MRRMILVAALMATVLAGCGTPSTLTLTLTPEVTTVIRGGTAVIDVTLSGSAVASGVVLAVSGAPTGVNATIADTSLEGGQSTTTLTIDTEAGAAEGMVTLSITAAGSGISDVATLALSIESLPINGTLVNIFGGPYGGLIVSSQSVTTTADVNGAFTLTGLTVPYDLVVVVPTTPATYQVFEGLTTDAPEVGVFDATFIASLPTATINGTLPAAVPTAHVARVCVEGVSIEVLGCQLLMAGDTTYSVTATWQGESNQQVVVHAIVYQADANGVPQSYAGYGTGAGAVVSGGTTAINATLAPVTTTRTLTINRISPAGFEPTNLVVGVKAGTDYYLPIVDTSSPAITLGPITLPEFADVDFAFLNRSDSTGATTAPGTTNQWEYGLTGGTTTATASLPATLVSPAAGATGVTSDTPFLVGGVQGSARTFVIRDDASVGPTLAVTTMDTTLDIPDLNALGYALLPANSYSWGVIEAPGFATIDDAASGWVRDFFEAYLTLSSAGETPPRLSGTTTETASRGFTTP